MILYTEQVLRPEELGRIVAEKDAEFTIVSKSLTNLLRKWADV